MSPFRRLLMFLGFLILAVSLVLLVLASLPVEHRSESEPVPQQQLTLPTPEAFLPAALTIGRDRNGAIKI
jgi:hypothetical protein